MNNKQPFLCRLGLHKGYHYLPKVGGDLGVISIACERCGYGHRYGSGTWDIPPQEVQEDIRKQPQIEFGRILGFLSGIGDPITQMEMAYGNIKTKFNESELEPIKNKIDEMHEWRRMSEEGSKAGQD